MEEGLRRLEHQDAEVGIARGRLLQLMTVVTAATAFLAAAAVNSSHGDRHEAFYALAVVATSLYGSLLVLLLRALQPLRGWIIETSPKVLVQDYGDRDARHDPASLAETYRSLALHYEAYADSNEIALGKVRGQLSFALILGGAQIVCWVIVAWLVA